ncbi:MAG: S-layer homology domain-containing protein [Oscillospiraceae bacterium]|nr:S-layer homology domain-containing protein [Oscillospiraceae bacterium]
MRKPFLRALCSFLILIFIVSLFAALPVSAQAEGLNEVEIRLRTFVAAHPDGSRWPEEFDGGISCFGFAKLAVYNIFGLHDESGRIRTWDYWGNSSSGMTLVASAENSTAESTRDLLLRARPGDVLELEPYTRNQHTMIVYEVNENGWTVYDCNWDGQCSIRLQEVSFSFFNHWQGAPLHLLRADNYDEIVKGVAEEPSYDDELPSPPEDGDEAGDEDVPAEDVDTPLPEPEEPEEGEKCLITYNTGDCENTPGEHYGIFSDGKVSLKLPDIIPSRKGYEFKGWLLFGNSTFDISRPGQELRYYIGENEPLCFYAVWERLPGSMDNFVISSPYDGRFLDVSENDWFYDNVSLSFGCGLIKGSSEHEFSPGGNVTIAEAITLASRLHSIYYTGSEGFAEVSGPWYQKYLNYAVSEGIVSREYTNYLALAERWEFAELLSKALPSEALEEINAIESGFVPDIDESEVWEKGVYALYRAGILTGSDREHGFMPESPISRAEAAAIITRMAFPEYRKVL